MGGFFFRTPEMFKRLLVTLGILAGLFSPVHAAGTIPFSLSQQLDQYGKPLAGCLFYTIQAGTTSTPQNAYQDSGLTIPLPNPQTCDSAGRLPQMFLADGTIKVRLTDKNGVTQVVADNIQVVGASSGSGGGGTVDPTTILATGDMKITYGTGALSGFVRANGRTIGSATSGATERANADTQALFEYLWGADANLTVSGGRGVSAAADWAANKTITLPDLRGRTIAGLDDMGSSAAGRLTSSYFGLQFSGVPTTLGAVGGLEKQLLTASQLPVITPTFSGTAATINVTQNNGYSPINPSSNTPATGGSGGSVMGILATTPGSTVGQITSSGTYTPGGSISSFGGGAYHPIVPPMMVMTYYLKL